MIIAISAKGFAEFVIGGPSKRRQIARNIQKPKSTAAQIVTHYYARAVKIIRIYHSRNNDVAYLTKELADLEAKITSAKTAQGRAGVRNNLRALRGYLDVYGQRKRSVIARPRIYYTSGSVRLSASPDLALEEGGRIKLVKLGTTKSGDDAEMVRVMLRVIYQAAVPRFNIEPQDVSYFDISRAVRVQGEEADADLAATIDKGCNDLSLMF